VTPVPSFTRRVCAAREVRTTMGSRMRSRGFMGEAEVRGSGSMTCSPTQSDSHPAPFATRAMWAAASG
jgi:hypothetical protein